MLQIEHDLSFEKIQEVIEQSIDLFQEQEVLGIWFLTYIIVCTAVAVFTYPRCHRKSFWIFIISLFLTVTYVYQNELYHGPIISWHILKYSVYGIWYSLFFALIFWIIICILYLCEQDKILNWKTRLLTLVFSVMILCLTARIWYGALTTMIFITAALL